MSLVMSVHAADQDEFAYGYKGHTLIYRILSESERTCAVTDYTSGPVGALELPDCVYYRGIEYTLVEISRSAFSVCSDLTSVVIPNSVKTIGDYAFNNCSRVTSVVIGNSVKNIGYGAFAHCYELTSVEIPNSVQTIGDYAFAYCSKITSCGIPISEHTIGDC
ncbi:MAG: leucine-rich repeat domain-containing protein, partial [Duncaniella sp.]|nr:leucine-rich repeat domain-containing protein [Duncaniella sp.]